MGVFTGLGSLFGPWGTAIGGAADYLVGKNDAQDTNDNAATQQRVMRQTAYQDTVGDLKTAGLNPMLAFSNGATASAYPQIQNKGLAGSQQQLNSAQAVTQGATVENIRAQTDLTNAQTEKVKTEIPQITTSTANVSEQTKVLTKTLTKMDEEIRKITIDAETTRQMGLSETDRRNLMNEQKELARIQGGLANNTMTLQDAQTAYQKVITNLKHTEMPGAKNQEAFDKSEMGKAAPYGRAVGTIINGAKNLVR